METCETCLMWSHGPLHHKPRDGYCYLDEYRPEVSSAHYTCIHHQPKEAEDE